MSPFLGLALLGVLMILEPVVSAIVAGARSDEDVTRWMMSMPMIYIQTLRLRMVGGAGVAATGLALHWVLFS